MSIGIVIAESVTFELIDKRYYILTPFKSHGGMYTYALYANNIKPDLECSREKAMNDLRQRLTAHDVATVFAYNAAFDYRHLPELRHLDWHDIMKLAAYRQHNPKIPSGVESVYRMLSEDWTYCEMHNALTDAIDEMEIMRLLNHELGRYVLTKIG
jgi:hypothetical protein